MSHVERQSRRRRIALSWLLCGCMAWPVAAQQASSRASAPSVTPAPAELRQVLDRHLAAINARDLDALLSTVTAGAPLTTILPNGTVLDTREQYRQLHVDWFKDRDWRMVFEVQDLRVIGDTGIARVRYDAQARAADRRYASKRQAILTLLFAREPGGWRLVYDQNTVIPTQTN
jgi:uncharacterized protein (TIGR02246 family)